MRYKVGPLEIRSENAAKPLSQAAQPLVKWLRRLKPVGLALDYGCGKLRYSGHLAKKCRRLTLVDSRIQLDRVQMVAGCRTTVREFSTRKWPNCKVLSVDEFDAPWSTYDFILCANVLSAIPDKSMLSEVLGHLRRGLKPRGLCLFVTQYRNSDFRKMAASKNARPHLYGWVLVTKRGTFYYGVLDLARVKDLIKREGFLVTESWIEGESAYVLATRQDGASKCAKGRKVPERLFRSMNR
jgi:SAM-dependent methyltransferase